MNGRRKLETGCCDKILPNCNCNTTNRRWVTLGFHPDLHDEKAASNHLTYDTDDKSYLSIK
jgi:hypothetical protein